MKDPRGAAITLSHFCPTAAALLFEPTPLTIVEAPGALALDGALEGLDATAVLPPLLSQGVLADWKGYSAWEESAVSLFNVAGIDPEQAVDALERATRAATRWKPGGEPLASAVRRAFAAVLGELRSTGPGWNGFGRTVNAFLAAHAFASWAAYQADGLSAIPRAVRQTLDLLAVNAGPHATLTRPSLIEAIRRTDLRVRHQ